MLKIRNLSADKLPLLVAQMPSVRPASTQLHSAICAPTYQHASGLRSL
jgi:hypothetical protein